MRNTAIPCIMAIFTVLYCLAGAACPRTAAASDVIVRGFVLNNWENAYDVPGAKVSFISAAGDTVSDMTGIADGLPEMYEVILSSEESGVEDALMPETFALRDNYPNPFNPSTTIPFELANDGQVTLDIYNIAGQRIRRLWDGWCSRGAHRVRWDGADDRGAGSAAGVYLYRLTAGGASQTRKMLLLDGGSSSGSARAAKVSRRAPARKAADASYDIVVTREGFAPYREEGFIVHDGETELIKHFTIDFLYSTIRTENYAITTVQGSEYRKSVNQIQSCPGGGGLFILEVTPLMYFAGEIDLTVSTDSLITSELLYDTLSYDSRVTEISVKTSHSIDPGIDSLRVDTICIDSLRIESTYEGKVDTLICKINIVNDPYYHGYNGYRNEEFTEWLEINHPELGTLNDQEWFGFPLTPDSSGGSEFVLLSETWDMRKKEGSIPPYDIRMLLRRRGELTPTVAVKKDENGLIMEIPVEEYGYPY